MRSVYNNLKGAITNMFNNLKEHMNIKRWEKETGGITRNGNWKDWIYCMKLRFHEELQEEKKTQHSTWRQQSTLAKLNHREKKSLYKPSLIPGINPTNINAIVFLEGMGI